MPNNWGAHFMTDGYEDHIAKSAVSIVEILEAPGMFMLEVGMTDEDLEDHDRAIAKVEAWLRKEHEGRWLY